MKNKSHDESRNFGFNVSYLRKRRNLSQTQFAVELGIKRTSLIGYEKGVQPPFNTILKIADYLGVSIDALMRLNLSKLGEFELTRIEQGFDVDITGSKLRLLVSTADSSGNENIEMVEHQAQAGYTTGYKDPEFIDGLPKFQLPFLNRGKTYRCFQIEGDSMPPVVSKSWVTASFIENWTTVKNGTPCVVVTKDDGIVFKLVYNKIETNKTLQLVSTNRLYDPFTVSINAVSELWKFETFNGFEAFE